MLLHGDEGRVGCHLLREGSVLLIMVWKIKDSLEFLVLFMSA